MKSGTLDKEVERRRSPMEAGNKFKIYKGVSSSLTGATIYRGGYHGK